MKTETIISTSTALRDLAGEIGLFKSAKKDIRIYFDHLTEQENDHLQHRVVKYYKACGCSQGRVTGIITQLGFIILMITGIVPVRELGIGKTFLYYFLCSFITMFIGKITGLWQARVQLQKLANEFEQTQY